MDAIRAQAIMKEQKLDALIVSSPENLFYAAGLDCLPTSANTIMFMLRRIGPVFVLMPQKGEPHLILSYGAFKGLILVDLSKRLCQWGVRRESGMSVDNRQGMHGRHTPAGRRGEDHARS